jgi:predicted DCC family thiol-disulfide oxidoreductase YuxK
MAALRVANPPERPLAVFDGDCGFCRQWIERWRARTGPRVDYAPSQEVAPRFPEIPPEAFARAFQLVLPDGRALEGAAAVLATLDSAPGDGRLSALARVPFLGGLLELAYRLVARHRPAASVLTRLLWGRSVEKPTYFAASALFLRALGLCYLVAFVSLWVQVDGLIGARGILPVGQFLDWVRGQTGSERYWLLPTLCWISSSDAFLHLLCGGGVLAALLLVLGLAPAMASALCWALYLSLAIAGQAFLQFQWDYLLLEVGLLAIFLVPPWRWRFGRGLAAAPVVLFLLRWLLFRLMFSSGWVKLASGDPTWRNLTALRFHYETQPLPPWTAWYLHQSPTWFQTVSALFLFFVELVVPFLYFAPRRLRLFAFRATVLLQLLIAATGNYGFFNLLALALALLLLDDQSLRARWRHAVEESAGPPRAWPKAVLVPVACVVLFASSIEFAGTLGGALALPRTVAVTTRLLTPFRSFNRYGLFMVMTTERPEILIEGSNDGADWRPYLFRWKPGDVTARPRFVAPHQPRLDWQMWFAALGTIDENPWLVQFLGRLLEGSPEVVGLLAANPFPDRPPRYVRATAYDYRFTDAAERRRTGAWWRRKVIGPYTPILSAD